jgi:hypothetical protein
MPGVIGLIGPFEAPRLDASLRKLAVLPGCVSAQHRIAESITLATVSRGGSATPPSASFARDERVAVLVHGAIFREAPRPHRLVAADLLAAAGSQRLVEALGDCDGGYVVVGVRLAEGVVTVLSDRMGTQPIYYGTGARAFAFGPEAKSVLTLTGLAARYSTPGLLGFLTTGYNLGAQTLFEGVSYLEPGTVLTHHLPTGATSVRRYWCMSFAVDRRLERRRVAEEAAFDATVRSHRLLLSDGPASHQVLLSGGWDSRGMLGTLQQIGAPPRQAVAWGLRDDIPGSDAQIAARLASAHGIPFRFLPYSTGAFVDNAREWAFTSELANDNVGWYGEGLGSLRDFYAAGSGVSFVGDELWGSDGRPGGEGQVRASATMPKVVPAALEAILRPGAAREARAAYEASLGAVMAPCAARDLIDRRDYLYLHGRVARFIMSLGYYKEHATEIRRPYLTRAILEVVTGLPGKFRLYKNLYGTMLARLLPGVTGFPDNVVSSLPDWSYDVRREPRLRGFLLSLLQYRELEDGPLAALVDAEAFEAVRDRFFAAPVAPLDRACSRWQAARRTLLLRSRTLHRANAFRKSLRCEDHDRPTSEFDILRRVALLILLQRRLPDLASC